jgi:hypothetical protein
MRVRFATLDTSERETSRAVHPEDLLPEIQSALAALADVDTHYRIEREHLERWFGPEEARDARLAELHRQHRRERAPLLQRLTELQEQMSGLCQAGFSCAVH